LGDRDLDRDIFTGEKVTGDRENLLLGDGLCGDGECDLLAHSSEPFGERFIPLGDSFGVFPPGDFGVKDRDDLPRFGEGN